MPKIESSTRDANGEKESSPEVKVASRGRKKGHPILILIIVVVVLVVVGFIVTRFLDGDNVIPIGGSSGDYQAVFLINGQVYFGHVVKESKDQVVLEDIYYLRATEALQQSEEGAVPASELSLIKLGNELHGPKDEMRIVRNNILFIEDLKEDSKVTIAIEEYIASQD